MVAMGPRLGVKRTMREAPAAATATRLVVSFALARPVRENISQRRSVGRVVVLVPQRQQHGRMVAWFAELLNVP
jgi:hypothetical protein